MNDIIQSNALDMLAELDASSVACIVTDPPYGIGYHSNRHEGRNPHSPIGGDWNFQIGSFFGSAEKVLSDGGAIYLFTRFDVLPLWQREIPPSLSLKNVIVWDKGNHSSGDLTGNFGFRHELIMFITKGRHQLRGRRLSNVWAVPKIPSARLRMPAEKPAELYGRAIFASSDEGDLVVDPFGGSATLAEAAITYGRRFMVSDIDPAMVRIGRKRVGLPIAQEASAPPPRPCPVLKVDVPDPRLWAVHPEDLADYRQLRTVTA